MVDPVELRQLERGRIVETCENCGRAIGKLETPHVFRNNITCPECWAKLQPAAPPASGQSFPINIQVVAGGVQTIQKTAKKWKALRLIALLAFIFGVTFAMAGSAAQVMGLAEFGIALIFISFPIYIFARFFMVASRMTFHRGLLYCHAWPSSQSLRAVAALPCRCIP